MPAASIAARIVNGSQWTTSKLDERKAFFFGTLAPAWSLVNKPGDFMEALDNLVASTYRSQWWRFFCAAETP